MDARRGSRHHAPAADTRFGSRVAGSGSPAPGGRHAAVPTGGIPPSRTPGRRGRPQGRRRRTDRRPGLRHLPHAAQPHRTAPQRQQRLHGADRLAPAGRAVDPHGVLYHPRRPHRTHHRRNPDTQSPRGTRSARHLRRRRLVAAQPHDAAPHARGGSRRRLSNRCASRGSPRASPAATTAK